MTHFVIIVAGGSGSRMESSVPKQFHLLAGKPLLQLTMDAFIHALEQVHIILVVPKEYLQQTSEIAEKIKGAKELTITTGGATRFESVKNGLRLVPEESIVFVHDAVRCLITPALIERCLLTASRLGNAVPAITSVDSVRLETGTGNMQIDRRKIKIVQTPQTFRSAILKKAYLQPFTETFTDDASVVEAMGEEIHLVEGESTNIKITVPMDMIVAEEILKRRN